MRARVHSYSAMCLYKCQVITCREPNTMCVMNNCEMHYFTCYFRAVCDCYVYMSVQMMCSFNKVLPARIIEGDHVHVCIEPVFSK